MTKIDRTWPSSTNLLNYYHLPREGAWRIKGQFPFLLCLFTAGYLTLGKNVALNYLENLMRFYLLLSLLESKQESMEKPCKWDNLIYVYRILVEVVMVLSILVRVVVAVIVIVVTVIVVTVIVVVVVMVVIKAPI